MYSFAKPSLTIQVSRISDSVVSCKLITGITGPVEMLLKRSDYEVLQQAGLFVEAAKSKEDGVLKTTETFRLINSTE